MLTGVVVAALTGGLIASTTVPAHAAAGGDGTIFACAVGYDSSLQTAEGRCEKPARKYRLTAKARKGKDNVRLDSGWVSSPKPAKVTAPEGYRIVEDSIDITGK